MSKRIEIARIEEAERLAEGVYSLCIATEMAREAKPGQFVSLFSKDGSKLMPRPISICQIDPEKGRLRLVYRVVGEGTREFAQLATGQSIRLMGLLGNGFSREAGTLGEGERPLLVGGGIGIPPMVGLAEQLHEEDPDAQISLLMGYRNADTFLTKECQEQGKLYLATDDGSLGSKGTVLDALEEEQIETDIIYACGPKPMLRALQEYAISRNIPCYISMEERMACGIGACLGCVTKTREVDDHSKVKNTRVCADGPVFDARKVDLS